jgi:hypothetical protein
MVNRVRLADALHRSGHLPEAEAAYLETEAIHEEVKADTDLYFRFQSHRYIDLLLSERNNAQLRREAEIALTFAEENSLPLITRALDHMAVGRALLAEAQKTRSRELREAAEHLSEAVDLMRAAGTQHEMPRALLGRASARRQLGDFVGAEADINHALSVARRGNMRLHEADAHIEYARLHVARERTPEARAELTQAKTMIADMGYDLRRSEVAELERVIR